MLQKVVIGLAILLPLILGVVFALEATIAVLFILSVLVLAYGIGDAIMEYKWGYM